MRYYDIIISEPNGGGTIRRYTSHPNGTSAPPDPGALNVEMDILAYPFATPGSGSYVRVWGISIEDIGQALDLNDKDVAVYGGMGVGLPLANPQEAGLLIRGQIWQAFGNWQGVNMTLDLIIISGAGENAPFVWKAGTSLQSAIEATLKIALPGYQTKFNIQSNLVMSNDETGQYQNLTQFSQYIKGLTKSILGGFYEGVEVRLSDKTLYIYDGKTVIAQDTGTAKVIAFNDMIGQVTWIDFGIVQLQCVMRADISIGDLIKLPPGQVTTTAQSYSRFRQSSIFQGNFLVQKIRHVGNFRQPDGISWITIIDAAAPVAAEPAAPTPSTTLTPPT